MYIDRLSILRVALRQWAQWHINCNGYPGVSPSSYRQAGGGGAYVQRLPRGVNIPTHVQEVITAFGRLGTIPDLRQPLGAVRGWYLRDKNHNAEEVAQELGLSPGSFHAYRKQGELAILTTIASLR
jgi:hypothetical protein